MPRLITRLTVTMRLSMPAATFRVTMLNLNAAATVTPPRPRAGRVRVVCPARPRRRLPPTHAAVTRTFGVGARQLELRPGRPCKHNLQRDWNLATMRFESHFKSYFGNVKAFNLKKFKIIAEPVAAMAGGGLRLGGDGRPRRIP